MGRKLPTVAFALLVATTTAGAQQALPVRDPLDGRPVLPAEEPRGADEWLDAALRDVARIRRAGLRGEGGALNACVAACRTRWVPRQARRAALRQVERYGACFAGRYAAWMGSKPAPIEPPGAPTRATPSAR